MKRIYAPIVKAKPRDPKPGVPDAYTTTWPDMHGKKLPNQWTS